MSELQGWLTIAALLLGFAANFFMMGVSWGRFNSELHRICERLIDGFKAAERDRRDLGKRLDNHSERLRQMESGVAALLGAQQEEDRK